jgi:leucyl/phenylalanyl-tRNA---protein transferase
MPVYRLSEELSFPHPTLAAEGGLLAVGGDLRLERILLAYRNGIFPWYSEGRPILWWCPAPRLVLFPRELRIGRSLVKALRRDPYRITLDQHFRGVMQACAETPRPGQDGTWITQDLEQAFVALHEQGLAHSVEAWEGDDLVGGLYGLAIGRVFFGESMFARRPDASKIAFVRLVRQLDAWDFDLIDCQVVTEHLVRFGAREIELEPFLELLRYSVDRPMLPGPWSFDADASQG